VLDQAFLAQSYLAGTPVERGQERAVLGQDALRRRMTLEKRP
jgi:hypothetical protein